MKTRKDYGRLVIRVKQGAPVFIGEEIAIAFQVRKNGEINLLVIAPKDIRVKRSNG